MKYNLVNEIGYTFNVLQNQPIDSRFICSSLNNVDVEIPIETRYVGLKIWIENLNKFFIFKNGVNTTDLILYNNVDIETINKIEDLDKINNNNRFIGQLVFIKNNKEFYCFKDGIKNEDLKILNNDIIIINKKIDIVNIEMSKRYHGRLFFIMESNELYCFINECNDSDILLVNSSGKDYYIVNNLSEMNLIHERYKKIGTQVYDLSTELVYIYRDGIEEENLQVLQNIEKVPSLEYLQITQTYPNKIVWVMDIEKFVIYDELQNKFKNIINDCVSFKTDEEFDYFIMRNNDIFRPSFIIRENINEVWFLKNNKYYPITINSIPEYKTIEDCLQDTEINKSRVRGKLYYIIDNKSHYYFSDSITDIDFIPIHSNKTISTIDKFDDEFPLYQRIVGNTFLTKDTNFLYYLTSKNTYNKISSLSTIEYNHQIKSYETLLINHNLNSQLLFLEIRNSDNELVQLDWVYGKFEYDDNDKDIENIKSNYISLKSGLTEQYNIIIKTL